MTGGTHYRFILLSCFSSVLSAPVHADSAGLAGASQGNSFNPAGIDVTRKIEPQGLSLFRQHARTPSGILYPGPYLAGNDRELTGRWIYKSSIDLGFLGNDGDESSAEYHDYRDFSEGALINYLDFSLLDSEQGYYLGISGGGIGRDDQYYHLTAGQPEHFRITGFFNETHREYGRNARTIFSGAGTENLTLPPSLQPGSNTVAQVQEALPFASNPGLRLVREQSGVGIEYDSWPGIELFARFKHQDRDGSRPYGASLLPPFFTGGNAGGVVETIEPLDYSTNEFSTGFSYADINLQWNLQYKNSFFSNNKTDLIFESPFTNIQNPAFTVERGRFDLYPDNDYHELTTDFSYRLPLKGQFFATVSWSRMQQNDSMLPPTVNSGPSFSGINLDQWNTIEALPGKAADAEIENLLVQAGVQLAPFNAVSIRSAFRYQDEDNNTDFTAFNPLAGQFGYVTADGAASDSVFKPGTVQIPIHYRSIPFARETLQWNMDSTYRITQKAMLGLDYLYEERRLKNRERDQTEENRLKLYLSSRSLSWATLRLSHEYSERTGSQYNFNPYEPFYTSSLPGFQAPFPEGSTPHTLADLRKFDVSDRRQNRVSVTANFLLGETHDLLFTANWLSNDYDARYGLQNEDKATINLEWNYQPSPQLSSYVFYSYQDHGSQMANINDAGTSPDPNAGGITFPLSSAWTQESEGESRFAGVGLQYAFGLFDIDTSYSYTRSDDQTKLRAASSAALASPEFANSDSRLPDLEFSQHSLETSVRWHPRSDVSLRFYHRYERSRISDWHFQQMQPLIGRHLFLNATPQNYAAHLLGMFVQYRFE